MSIALPPPKTIGAVLLTAFSLAPAAAYAQAAFAGQYVGQAKIAYSGAINSGPSSVGLVSFSVGADGTVAEIGNDLLGTIDSGGTITWQTPNALSFTTGTISGNILTATAATTANGLTVTRSVVAGKAGEQFPPGESFSGQLTDLNPVNGYGGHTAVQFLNGGFVAVGNAGGIVLSDDGLTWRRSFISTTATLNAITYGNGIYVAGGDDGALFTSPDGMAWTKRNSPFLFSGIPNIADVEGAAFGNGVFVITSDFGKDATSTDGITWTEGANPAGGGIHKVTFLNGKFVQYLGSANRFSSNGVSWTTPTAFTAKDITFGNGKFAAANGSGIFTSADGTAWTQNYSGNTAQVDFGNGRFVARTVGSSGTQLYSDDGVTWNLASFSLQSGVADIAFGNGRYVMAGGDLITSPDGISWGRLKKNRLALSPVDFKPANSGNPTLYFETMIQTDAGGNKGVMDVNTRVGVGISAEYFAGDGGKFFLNRSSTSKKFLDLGTTADLHAIIANFGSLRGGYVAGGGGVIRKFVATGPSNTEILSAGEIVSPTSQTLRYGTNSINQNVATFVGDGGVIVNITNPEGPNPAAVAVASGTTADLRYVADVTNGLFGGSGISAFVAVGANGTLLVRDGGTGAWSARSTGTTETLIGIAYVSPNFVAVSETGGVITSPDLTTWTAGNRIVPPGNITRFMQGGGATPPIALGEFGFYSYAFADSGKVRFQEGVNSLTGAYNTSTSSAVSIAFGAGQYVALGGTSVSTSTNGKSWKTSILPASMNAVAYGEGKFIAVGGIASETASNDRIYFSADGLFWEKATMAALNRPLNSVTYGSGKFIAAGKRGVVLTSDDGISWTQVGGDFAPSDTVVSLTHNNGTFVGVGGGAILMSTDSGATFATAGTAGAAGLTSVTWGGGTFVAVGSAGNTIRYTGGPNWSRTQIPANQSSTGSSPVFNQVAYANDSFIATTVIGQAYVSSDGGVSWQEKFTGVNRIFTGSVVANGLAVFIGAGDIIGIAVKDNSPYVTTQPQPTTLNAGTPLNLSVTVSGNNPLTYQWTLNGSPLANGGSITGAGTATLAISNISPDFSGTYQVTVTNPDGSRTSREATVTVDGSAVVGYDAWKGGFTFPPGKDGPLDDADDDGVPNLIEFISGANPVQPGPSLLPGGGVLSGAQIGGSANPAKTYLTFKARVRKDRPGVTLVPQSGNTIADLTAPGASDLVAQAGLPVDDPADAAFEFITYYHTVAIEDSTSGKAFMRLGVSL